MKLKSVEQRVAETVQEADPRQKEKEKARAYRQKIKREVMMAYGNGRCSCCGESMLEFLTISHIYNDGAAHRKAISSKWSTGAFGKNGVGGNAIYVALRTRGFPHKDRITVECFNCNCGRKTSGKGVCPHQDPDRLSQLKGAIL